MSRELIGRNPVLQRLRDDGYSIRISGGYLVVGDLPYVAPGPVVRRGSLVVPLNLSGTTVLQPRDHTVFFAGEMPCDSSGAPQADMVIGSPTDRVDEHLTYNHQFSQKPRSGHYDDYYHQIATYAEYLEAPARKFEPEITGKRHTPAIAKEDDSPFVLEDTWSTAGGVRGLVAKLEPLRIAIVGIGGTGAYLLDLVAKTPVKEIHLYDGDVVEQHNIWRFPGAVSEQSVGRHPNKAEYFAEQYQPLRRGVIAHPYYVLDSNVDELRDKNFVFIAVDQPKARLLIAKKCAEFNVGCVDVGMTVKRKAGGMMCSLRSTLVTPENFDRSVGDLPTIDMPDEEYRLNTQVVEFNALNATVAVVLWKKHYGVYVDSSKCISTYYSSVENEMIND